MIFGECRITNDKHNSRAGKIVCILNDWSNQKTERCHKEILLAGIETKRIRVSRAIDANQFDQFTANQ